MVGRSLAHYKIAAEIGGGGMGVVYRARDTRLGRDVALKVLRAEMATSASRLERFKREARALAALDHPNIVHIYSVEEADDGTRFLTMQLVEGQQLDQLIPPSGLSLDQLLKIAIPLADAVAAAHERGITHRDLKPGNIMVTPEGRVKVLDFGLAKLWEPQTDERDTELAGEGIASADTVGLKTLTRDGGVLGTVPYMSPEQTEGKRVDHRSDVFSLGIVLYEMATGERPFKGDTSVSLVSSIVKVDPYPVGSLREDHPRQLGRIVEHCLEKSPRDRFQTARDVYNELRSLRREIHSTATISAERVASQLPAQATPRSPWTRVAIGTAFLILAAWAVWSTLARRRDETPQPALSNQVTAFPGWEADAAISPDGGLVAYASDQSGNVDLWLIDALGGNPLQLTDDAAVDTEPAWFPDGSALAFTSNREGRSDIWKVPRLGGPVTMLIPDASDPAISPDGTRIAFSRQLEGGDARIGVADLDGAANVQILTDASDGIWAHEDPAWSPDGERLVYADFGDLWLVPAGGGEARRLTDEGAGDFEPVWASDGRRILFSSYRQGTLALWSIPRSGGTPLRLTPGTGPERHPSVSADGARLAYATFAAHTDVVLVDLESGEHARLETLRTERGPTITPDGSALVFAADRWGGHNLWLQAIDGLEIVGEPRRLNDDPSPSANPNVSPDGRWIVYQRRVESDRQIWVVPSSGGLAQELIGGPGVRIHPVWSPDGSRIAYVEDRDGLSTLWVAPVADGRLAGDPEQVGTSVATVTWPTWSPDGSRIAYSGALQGAWDIWISPLDGSAPSRLTTDANSVCVRFRGPNTLLVSGSWGERGVSVRELDLETGRSTTLAAVIDFGPRATQGAFELDGAGRLLVYTREDVQGDVWLLEENAGGY